MIAVDGDVRDPAYAWHFAVTDLRPYLLHPETRMVIPPASWHMDFDRQVFGSLGVGARKVFLEPRGYAKSTKVSLVTPLVALARQLKQYLLLIENTGPQAKQAMSQIIHDAACGRTATRGTRIR